MNAATVSDSLAAATQALHNPDARIEAELLLAWALRVNRTWLYAHASDRVDASSLERLNAAVARRAAGEPLAYITGRREFWSLDLQVTPDVLIPRSETELLVELALQKIPFRENRSLADLGTGSGAVALALAHERPHARVLATDASAPALDVARGNAHRLALANIEFAQGDWCAALGERQFDLIATNPPYVAAGDVHLQRGDLRYEPPGALASGADGLDAIRRIALDAPAHLVGGGWLLIEHGFDQAAAVRQILAGSGLAEIFTARDLEDRERVSAGRRVSPSP